MSYDLILMMLKLTVITVMISKGSMLGSFLLSYVTDYINKLELIVYTYTYKILKIISDVLFKCQIHSQVMYGN